MNTDLWKMGSGLAAELVLGRAESAGFRRFARDRSRGGEGKSLAIIHSAAEIP
jgi:hypothetical protein